MNVKLFAELFGGSDRYRALKCLFEDPGRTFGPRELAAQAQIDPGNASRWLRRWADVGLLKKTHVLNRPRYEAAKDMSLAPLQQLFQQDSELVRQVRTRVAALGGRAKAAAVFGSTAKGTAKPDSDIDLLLLTEMSRLEAQAFFKAAGRKIGRPVDVLAYKPAEWERAVSTGNPLALDILNGPKIVLKGEINGPAQA